MTFDQCIEHILDSEGGFTLNPNDKGNYTPSGELKGTKYGISARMYPKLDIKNLTLEQAKLIYKKEYWDRPKINLLPGKIRMHYFDVCVNSGSTQATKLLQRAIGVKDDGILGEVTRSKLSKIEIEDYANERNKLYVNIVKKDATQLSFLQGWLKRNLKVTIISLKNELAKS